MASLSVARGLMVLGVVLAAAGCAGGSPVRALAEYRVLDDDLVAAIQPGLSRDDVLRMLGPPVETMRYPRLGHTSWDYRYFDTWGYPSIFSVTLDDKGIVVSRITIRLERDRPALR